MEIEEVRMITFPHAYRGKYVPGGGPSCIEPGCGRPEREHDVEMMASPKLWPQWPLLPLKNNEKKSPDGWFDSAVLIEAGGTVFGVKANMFEITKDSLGTLPRLEFSSFEELFDQGWRVD